LEIAAVHSKSRGAALVLWLHGIAVNRDEYLGFFKEGAEHLAKQGIDSLRFDFRGHGESAGSPADFSIIGQMLDVQAALRYLSDSYGVKLPPLYVVGASFGAPPALFTALRTPTMVRGLTLLAPVLSYQRTFLRPQTNWAKGIFSANALNDLAKTNRLDFGDGFAVSARLIEEMHLIHPEWALKEVSQKVVVLHGDQDSMVPFAVSQELTRNLRNCVFIPVHGMDHGFMDAEDEEGTAEQSQKNKQFILDTIAQACR
jgi:pimeloyl-ACP methyl ester carboxylesterase